MNSRNWLFTINNPLPQDKPLDWECSYVVFQLELGQEQTPHLQGYIQFEKNKRLSAVKKIHATAHWEPRKGTHAQAYAYNTKEDTRIAGPWTKGEPIVKAGQRTDLAAMEDVKALLDSGEPIKSILDSHFNICARHLRFFREYRCIRTPNRNFKTQATAIWGPTGTGKSRWCADNFPDAYWKPKSNWWDGYESHDAVVIDEFYGWIPYDLLLRILDRYPLVLETKGGHVNFIARYVFIVSNKDPETWYPKCDFAPLKRRLEAIQYKATLDGDFETQWDNPDVITPSTPTSPSPYNSDLE